MELKKYDLPSHESQNCCLKLNPPGVLHRHGGKGEGREGKKDLLLKAELKSHEKKDRSIHIQISDQQQI